MKYPHWRQRLDHPGIFSSHEIWAEHDRDARDINEFLYDRLTAGSLIAYTLGPNGMLLRVPPDRWNASSHLLRSMGLPITGPSTRYEDVNHPIFLRDTDLDRLVAEFGVPTRAPGGRPAKHGWPGIRLIAEIAWAERGDFGILKFQRPKWKSQADMVRYILGELNAVGAEEPPFSSLKAFVSGFVKEKRNGR
jgi:hypothetical protein